MKTYTLHVSGMHCASCPLLIEGELTDLPHISEVKASLKHQNIEITGEFGDKSISEIARDLTLHVQPHGYIFSSEQENPLTNWSEFTTAIPLASGFIALFIVLQKFGLVNFVTTSHVSYSTAFLIGMIASVSTCMAVVGGLVLSVSASFAKEGDRVHPQVLFHVGRLVSFFVLGGVIGMLGSVFQLGSTGTFILSVVVAVVLLILGVNLLGIFSWAKTLQPTLPGFLGKRVQRLKNINHTLTPILIGTATFFLPCGFTQSMQIYTLTTGGFTSGALTMFMFALGTFPVLAILSFSSLAMRTKTQSGVFFKTAGLVVIFFGLLNLYNSFVIAGIIPSLFNF